MLTVVTDSDARLIMSGVEVFGIVASAVQLADFALKIATTLHAVLERLRDYPAKNQLHLAQVEQLIATARLIQDNPGLQTPIVYSHLNATLIEAAQLRKALEELASKLQQKSSPKRYWNFTVNGKAYEKQISARFCTLEQKKSALLFCISVSHSDKLLNIQEGINSLLHVADQGMGSKVSQFLTS